MAKQLLKERFQELAGIKPLYENQGALSPQSNEWLKNQINMYFEGGDEPGTPGEQGEFEITKIEQGDPQKYDDAELAFKFLEELRGLGSMVVRFDDYIGDIKVTSDRGGDAIVTWVWPEGIDENDRFPGEDEAGMAPRRDRISNPDLLKILQFIKSTGIDPEDVIEAIKMDSHHTNHGLPKMDPKTWGFNK